MLLVDTILRYEYRCNYLKKEKTLCQFFAAFLKFSLNFKYFQKKDDPHRFCIFENTDPENVFI